MNTPDMRLVPVEAVQRLILAADSFGVRYLDSDDMTPEAEELQAATEVMKDILAADGKAEAVAWRYKLDDETAQALFRPGWNFQEHKPPVQWGSYGRLITEAEPLYTHPAPDASALREPTREEIEHAYQQGYGKAVFNDEGRIKAHNAGLDAILALFRGEA